VKSPGAARCSTRWCHHSVQHQVVWHADGLTLVAATLAAATLAAATLVAATLAAATLAAATLAYSSPQCFICLLPKIYLLLRPKEPSPGMISLYLLLI